MASSDNHTGAALADATNLPILNKVNTNAKPSEPKTTRPRGTARLQQEPTHLRHRVRVRRQGHNQGPRPQRTTPNKPTRHPHDDRSDPKAEEIVAKFVYDAKQKDVNVNCSFVLQQSIKSVLRENSVKCIYPSWSTQMSKSWWNKNDTSIRPPGAIDDDNWNQTELSDYKLAYHVVEVVSPILSATSKDFDLA